MKSLLTVLFFITNFFDAQGSDCFTEDHPQREQLVDYFYEAMKRNRFEEFSYHSLR